MTRLGHNKEIGIQGSIRKILFSDWDPLNVNDNPLLQDEYDCYIVAIHRIVVGSRSEDEIVEFLFRTETEAMGGDYVSPEQRRSVARKLLALDV
jgi:hypothetical protein